MKEDLEDLVYGIGDKARNETHLKYTKKKKKKKTHFKYIFSHKYTKKKKNHLK